MFFRLCICCSKSASTHRSDLMINVGNGVTCFLRFLRCLRYVQLMYPDFTSNNRNIFALLQNCIIKLICFIFILISVSTSLFHDFKTTIFVFKNHNRITVPDLCGIIVFVPEIILAVDRSTKGLAFETHANAFRCILNA